MFMIPSRFMLSCIVFIKDLVLCLDILYCAFLTHCFPVQCVYSGARGLTGVLRHSAVGGAGAVQNRG